MNDYKTVKLDYADPLSGDSVDESIIEQTSPEITDSEDYLGDNADPERIDKKDALERIQELGLYTNADEEHPAELKIDEELTE